MNLPNYFLADLPPQAELSAALISEAMITLRRNRESYLLGRTTAQIVRLLTEVATHWLQPDDPFRKLALEHGPVELGFSRETLTRGLDDFFRQLTEESFKALLEQELGDAQRLDELVASDVERCADRASIVTGPEILVHIAAGNIPNSTLTSMVFGLLTRSAQFVKCARGTSLLPRLFAHSIHEREPKLATCLEVAEWRGGTIALEDALFAEADCVTATGSDETLAAIRARLPSSARFLGYGHRLSFGYVAGEVLTSLHARKLVERAAEDVVAWDQLGCLSPHVFYVQSGGIFSPLQFAEQLAAELVRREVSHPRGKVSTEVAAVIASRRSIYEMRAAASNETQLWQSQESTAWTVVCEADTQFPVSCLHRFVYVKPVRGLTEALQNADSVRKKISTVGIAVPEHRTAETVKQLARWGATRVCSLGKMQAPSLLWRHDGRPALADLLTWTDFES